MVRDVAEAHGELRRQLAAEKEAVLEKERERAEEELTATTREAKDHWKKLTGEDLNGSPAIGLWERSLIIAKKLAALLFVAADIPISIWFWRMALVTSDAVVLLIGIGVSVGVAIATHFSLLNFADDKDRPLRSIRICRSVALAAGLVALVTTLVLFFSRGVSPEMGPLVLAVFVLLPGALWLLSVSLPILAGALSSWARFEERPCWYGKAIERAQGRLFEINQALNKIDALRSPRPDPAQPEVAGGSSSHAEPPLVAVEKSRKSALPAALIFCVLSTAAAVADAQDTSPPRLEVAQAQSQPTAMIKPAVQGKSCEVWADESSSVNQQDRAEALQRMNSLLSEFTKALDCRRIRLGRFTDEGPYAKFFESEIPQPASYECSRTTSKYASVFKLFRDVEEQKAGQECSARRQDATRKFEAERAAVLGNAQKILLKDKTTQPQERCTDIVGLLKTRVSMAAEPTLILIFTDLISDCQSQIPEMQIPPTVRVVFLMLPPDRKRISATRVEDWLKMWATAVPEATRVPWVNLTPSWIRRLPQIPSAQVAAVQNGNR
jgi:hypothetical protein